MSDYTFISIIATIVILVHFGVPLLYYLYAKTKWLTKSWGIKVSSNYKPKVSIIIPTFNEALLIEKKLNNIIVQTYPKDKLEIIVIDSASRDNTPFLVRKWAKKHSDITLKIIEEPERKGKGASLNNALSIANGNVVIITDVDALWPAKNTINEVVKWFNDPIVGAVSCVKKPNKTDLHDTETSYRDYYNIVRVAESKAWSTPIFHGELAAFRRKILEYIGGFPIDIGSDDSYTAAKVASLGYRAIIPENIICIELIPKRNYHAWRIRRAQHLLQHFLKILGTPIKNNLFKIILFVEAFLHIINPWLLLIASVLLASSILLKNLIAIWIMGIGIILLIYTPFRLWVMMQTYLMLATLNNIRTKAIVWEKQDKIFNT